MPDLRCVKRTADSVLFACCPPFPLERNVSTLHFDKRISSESGIHIKLNSLFPLIIINHFRQKSSEKNYFLLFFLITIIKAIATVIKGSQNVISILFS
tara:strand:+ start:805 stop:1098 length:294 start_codon:yes stop_codon:yes gene_type:complete